MCKWKVTKSYHPVPIDNRNALAFNALRMEEKSGKKQVAFRVWPMVADMFDAAFRQTDLMEPGGVDKGDFAAAALYAFATMGLSDRVAVLKAVRLWCERGEKPSIFGAVDDFREYLKTLELPSAPQEPKHGRRGKAG